MSDRDTEPIVSAPTAEDIQRAIATIEDSRTTHIHWAEYRAKGGTDDPGAGDEDHHRRCIVEYDHVLAVLRYAIQFAGRGDVGLIPHTCPYCGGLHAAKPFPDTGQNPTHRRGGHR